MSELEELVLVDTTEELSDPSSETGADHLASSLSDSERTFKLAIDDTDDDNCITQSDVSSKPAGRDRNAYKTIPNLSYERNAFGILLNSKFKVRAEMEDIPGSSERKCHFSVEGNEISIKFPLRGDDRREMKRNGAKKAIDFIMGLDRVPARLAELMTVPKEEVVNPVAKNSRLGQQGDKKQLILRKRSEPFQKFREICAELTQANLVPKIDLVTRGDVKNGIKAKVVTRLPGLPNRFVATDTTNMLAKLNSVTKALSYAGKHSLGYFGAKERLPSEDTFQEQSYSYFEPYPADYTYWNEAPQNHISVHSRLAPRCSSPPLPASFDESPLMSYPTDTFPASQYDAYPDTFFDTTPPEIETPYYPQSSVPPHFSHPYPSMQHVRYVRDPRTVPYAREWKGPGPARVRIRRSRIASRRGKQPNML